MKIQCNTNNKWGGKTMTITYWNKTHNFTLSWLGSTTKLNKDVLTQIHSFLVWIDNKIRWMWTNKNIKNYQGSEWYRSFKKCPNTLGSTSGGCNFNKIRNTIINRRINNKFITTNTMYKKFRPFNKAQQIINTKRGKRCININKLTWYIIWCR